MVLKPEITGVFLAIWRQQKHWYIKLILSWYGKLVRKHLFKNPVIEQHYHLFRVVFLATWCPIFTFLVSEEDICLFSCYMLHYVHQLVLKCVCLLWFGALWFDAEQVVNSGFLEWPPVTLLLFFTLSWYIFIIKTLIKAALIKISGIIKTRKYFFVYQKVFNDWALFLKTFRLEATVGIWFCLPEIFCTVAF